MTDNDNSKAHASPSPKKQVVKSPNWPSIPIKEALEKAKLIYLKDRRTPIHYDVVIEHLGFGSKTGPAGRLVSALRQYGLIEKVGENYRISDKAWNIFNLPDDSPERQTLIAEAAMKPKIFKELLAMSSDGQPSDSTLKRHLVLTKDFNENTVERFLKIFKAAVDIAKPYDLGYSSAVLDEEEADDFEEEKNAMNTATNSTTSDNRSVIASQSPPLPSVPAGQRDFPLYLTNHQKGGLYIPAEMSKKDYDLLKQQIDNHLAIILLTSVIPDEENRDQ